MMLTPAQEYMILGFKIFGVERDAILGLVCMLDTLEQQHAMMEWMAENEGADTAQILREAVWIHKSALAADASCSASMDRSI